MFSISNVGKISPRGFLWYLTKSADFSVCLLCQAPPSLSKCKPVFWSPDKHQLSAVNAWAERPRSQLQQIWLAWPPPPSLSGLAMHRSPKTQLCFHCSGCALNWRPGHWDCSLAWVLFPRQWLCSCSYISIVLIQRPENLQAQRVGVATGWLSLSAGIPGTSLLPHCPTKKTHAKFLSATPVNILLTPPESRLILFNEFKCSISLHS